VVEMLELLSFFLSMLGGNNHGKLTSRLGPPLRDFLYGPQGHMLFMLSNYQLLYDQK